MIEYLKYLKGDRVIWIITLLMLSFSLVSVYSFVPILVKIEGGTPFKYLFKHFLYVVIGFVIMFLIHRRDPKYIAQLSKFAFYLAIALMIFTIRRLDLSIIRFCQVGPADLSFSNAGEKTRSPTQMARRILACVVAGDRYMCIDLER